MKFTMHSKKRLLSAALLAMSLALPAAAQTPAAKAAKTAPAQAAASKQATVALKDMRGKTVMVPKNLSRIATIDDGFIESVMTHLGEVRKVVAIGSWSMKRDYKYDFVTTKGESYTYSKGWNTMKYLNPWLNDLPCFNSPQGNIISYETLAKAERSHANRFQKALDAL